MTMTATVRVTLDERRRAWFRCPNCDRKIAFDNAFPFGFHFRHCGGCRWVWANVDVLDGGIGPHVDDLTPGDARSVMVVSNEEPLP